MITSSVIVRWLGRQDYYTAWVTMKQFTDQRIDSTLDEIWLLEHDPVFTQGQNGRAEHILNPGKIPVVQTDRGGQVTYHGPGQLIVYPLINLQRKKLNVRQLVTHLENSIINFLTDLNIKAHAKREAPGVYIEEKKICSIGLRIRRGCSYHGIAFNIAMDLTPFNYINPCGFSTLKMTQLKEFAESYDTEKAGIVLTNYLIQNLGYTNSSFHPLNKA